MLLTVTKLQSRQSFRNQQIDETKAVDWSIKVSIKTFNAVRIQPDGYIEAQGIDGWFNHDTRLLLNKYHCS